MSNIVMLTASENESFRNMNMDDVTEIDDGQFKELIKSFAELEDKIAKLAAAAREVIEVHKEKQISIQHYRAYENLECAIEELGEK